MDISKFNKTLAEKVARANRYEKQNDLQNAIKAWVEISEMALKATKAPHIDSSYRNMLIKKTQQIINHIKSLKLKLTEPARTEKVVKESTPKERIVENLEPVETTEEVETQPQETGDLNAADADRIKSETKALGEIKIIENSDFKNMPQGFKEIKPPEKFKTITPYDENQIKKRLSQEPDMDIFQQQKSEESKSSEESSHDKTGPPVPTRIELAQSKDGSKTNCFACGAELPPNSKTCPICGTNLN
jgi:ribosomal protein L40E